VQSFRQGIPEGFIPGFNGDMESKPKGSALSEGETRLNTEQSAQSLALGLLRALTLKPGNVLPLRLIPTGTVINTISLKPNGPGILVRSAGSFGQVVAQDEGSRYVHVRLQSGEVRKVLRDCCATVGKVSNPLWKHRSLGKAGRKRWLGIRPTVRGVAMNACAFSASYFICIFSYDDIFLGTTTPTEEAVESLNLTNIQCPFGVGAPKELGRGNLDLKDLRTAIKWSFVNVRGERRSWVWHRGRLHHA